MAWLLGLCLVVGVLNLAASVLIVTLLIDQHYRAQGVRWFRRPRSPGNGH